MQNPEISIANLNRFGGRLRDRHRIRRIRFHLRQHPFFCALLNGVCLHIRYAIGGQQRLCPHVLRKDQQHPAQNHNDPQRQQKDRPSTATAGAMHSIAASPGDDR